MSKKKKMILLTIFAVILFFQPNIVAAEDMVLYQEWDGGTRGGAISEAYFNTDPLTGIGSESVQVEVFWVNFSVYPGWREAQIQLAEPPWPEKTILANYQDGIFTTLSSVSYGGNSSVPVSPASNWLGENIRFGNNLLYDIPCCSGYSLYTLKEYVSPIALVPEPVSSTLFIIGGAALGFMRFRKSKV